ncbi:hypothetical protein F5B22DRAFT_585158 [Xylaria bambusicola]|uniref:uncharacterized protein n=1 Tax=Xylaria bambusicola TaxID=326684 RepID=UPI002008B27E|nr:uncharacterized protein F5B22DRAFT_585158 [Xylaria bambusicola]KAI0526287.1 hypothetical protein F5B22DRAFT_585158 [Xylaria bambusicola]
MALRSWEVDFGRRKPARTYLLENKAHFRHLHEISGHRGSFIRMAMKDSRDSQRLVYRADRIESFCGNLSIDALLNASSGLAVQPIALLDDRKADLVDMIKETGICRTQKGPLDPKHLHMELKKPRYSTTNTGTPSTGTAIGGSVPTTEPDAERRLIYITDLNRYTILVLLETASSQQAYFLRDFIYNHLAFAPSIGVTIPFTSFKSFAFAFHFPYYAWRKGPLYFQDERRMNDGRSLRRSQRLGFLNETPWGNCEEEAEDCIYEAQISCLVAGLDDSSYIGYGFVDTYHNGPESKGSVKEYHETSNTPGHYPMDPLSGGMLRANRPIWSPRLYFLRVLELRIEEVKEEWANSVFMLQKKTRAYIQDYQIPQVVYLSSDIEGRGERLRRFHDWTGSTVRLVMDLIHILSKTLHACDRFQSQDCGFFQDDNAFHKDTIMPSLCLAVIAKHVEEMKDQLQTLQHLEKVCNNISRELEAYIALEDRNVTMIQTRTNESVKAITFLAFLVSPPAVTSALYSMQDEVLPWPVDTRSWGFTIGFFYLSLGLVLWFLLKRSDRKRDLALRGQKCASQLPTPARTYRMLWIKRFWARCRAQVSRLDVSSPVSFEGDDRFIDDEETELSDLSTQPQPTGFL